VRSHYNICLAGNPNTGKSSIFNKLTKLKQHTGNWHGKTVEVTRGCFRHKGIQFLLDDVPGAYSLFGLSEDEIIARNHVFFENSDIVIVVCDPASLTKNLNLLFQVMEYNNKVILVVNLIDEAIKNDIILNRPGLMKDLGIPVVFTSAKTNQGIEQLKNAVCDVVADKFKYNIKHIYYPIISELKKEIEKELGEINQKEIIAMRILDADDEFFNMIEKHYSRQDMENINKIRSRYQGQDENRETILAFNFKVATDIVARNVFYPDNILKKTKQIDKILTSKIWGIPIMCLLLFVIFFITIKLANFPSTVLMKLFTWIENKMLDFAIMVNLNSSLKEFLVFGIYRTLAQVVAVMLPPMAIFFPLFTFLEDLGYLPRIAFNLDRFFQKSGCHGKQCLTMCMGFGCNAAAILGSRIIDSPRERLLAIITNTFAPCNGRFPLIFTLAACFLSGFSSGFVNAAFPALLAVIIIIIGILTTFLVAKILSKTLLKGVPSTFTLELPPYRKPNIIHIIYTSLINRTLFVLGRAIIVAAPVGGIIWILSNTYIESHSLLTWAGDILNPLGRILGMDGIILLAFILALPANEIVLPLIIMGYTAGNYLQATESIADITNILNTNGWTILTVGAVLLFSLLHFPCSTTLLTIYKETRSKKWTFLSFLIPTVVAIIACLILNLSFKILI